MNDILTLISETTVTDNDGYNTTSKKYNQIFCEVRSVGESEYFKSLQSGYEMSNVFIIWKVDYSDERLIEYNGKQYKIQRTYLCKYNDFIELHCSDLAV